MNACSGLSFIYYFQTEHAHQQKQNHYARSNAHRLSGRLKKGETKNFSSPQQPTLPLIFWFKHFLFTHLCYSHYSSALCSRGNKVGLAWSLRRTGSFFAGVIEELTRRAASPTQSLDFMNLRSSCSGRSLKIISSGYFQKTFAEKSYIILGEYINK